MRAIWGWTAGALAAGVIGFALLADGCAGDMALCEGPACREPPKGCATHDCTAERLCEQVTCEDGPWYCGSEAGTFRWFAGIGRCDDGDPCTNSDVCADGACAGEPIACDAPPANECIDADTLRSWTAAGTCERGFCNYPSSPVTCPAGCAAGRCTGEPCLGVVCDRPPECHESGGTCAAGECTYAVSPSGTPCGDDGSCSADGVCEAEPPPPTGPCDGKTPGECDRPHTSGGTCFEGQCAGFKCDPGWGDCNATWDDGCETQLGTPSHCSACGDACPAVAHGTPVCTYGECDVVCVAPWGNCDGNAANGCETQLGTPVNCSACGDVCSAAQGTPVCQSGTCGVSDCTAGWADCDGNAANGCETELGTASNCGGCGDSCATPAHATASCSGGQCTIACVAGWADCDGSAANGCETQLGTASNCSACGDSCGSPAHATASCSGGKCTVSCAAGWADCDGNAGNGCETELGTTANCAACGDTCPARAHATTSCSGGKCTIACVAGWADCDGSAANGCETQLGTVSNCASCGNACPARANASATCSNNTCGISCIAPWANCDGNAGNGCEIPVNRANRCDRNGLNSSTGCGTARCGSASGTNVQNFGSWYCTFCSHCHLWPDGWSWCLSASGQFSPDRCASCCNATLADQVCTP